MFPWFWRERNMIVFIPQDGCHSIRPAAWPCQEPHAGHQSSEGWKTAHFIICTHGSGAERRSQGGLFSCTIFHTISVYYFVNVKTFCRILLRGYLKTCIHRNCMRILKRKLIWKIAPITRNPVRPFTTAWALDFSDKPPTQLPGWEFTHFCSRNYQQTANLHHFW